MGGRRRRTAARPRRLRLDNAPKEDADGNQTVVVSCSQLIIESKRIVGTAGGIDQTLDELFAKLKAKEVGSKEALTKLMELVGQTTVEQAGLVIANAAKGSLPDGWVEYMDSQSNKKYYYNVHTKATTWTKPVKPREPPPPPEPARRRSGRVAERPQLQGVSPRRLRRRTRRTRR